MPETCLRHDSARRAKALGSALGARGASDAPHGKPPISPRLIYMPSPETGQKDKPRIAGPRCGDPTGGLCHFMAAKSERS